jgi:hypothetical protein
VLATDKNSGENEEEMWLSLQVEKKERQKDKRNGQYCS